MRVRIFSLHMKLSTHPELYAADLVRYTKQRVLLIVGA